MQVPLALCLTQGSSGYIIPVMLLPTVAAQCVLAVPTSLGG